MAGPETRSGPGGLAALAPWLGALVGLVVVMALAFWAVGQMRGDGDDPTIAAPSPTATTTAPQTPTGTSPPASPSPTEPATTPPSPTGTPTEQASIAPGEISVQVLDAAGDDGSAAAAAATELRDAGYPVVAENQAIRTYEETTVFYTEGNEPAGRQVAQQFGYPVVEPALDNLSSSVTVHVVVGADRA